MKLYIVPKEQVQRFWHKAEPLLQRALDKGDGEFSNDTLKLTVAQGQQQLLLLMKDDVCYCALTMQWVMYPHTRVAYITYIGTKKDGGFITKKGFEQFKNWVINNGGTSIQGSTKFKSIARLWNRLYGYEEKYTLMELKL